MTRDHGAELLEQVQVWRTRLTEAIETATPMNERGREMLVNIEAYRCDSLHFERLDDRVRAFECVLWAWAWLEIGHGLEALQVPHLNGDKRAR